MADGNNKSAVDHRTAPDIRKRGQGIDPTYGGQVVGPDDAAVLHPQREDPTRGIRDNDDIAFDRRTGAAEQPDRQSVDKGKSVSVSVELGDRRPIKKKKTKPQHTKETHN